MSLSIAAVTRCAETGVFRFAFDTSRANIAAELTVVWSEEKGLAWLRLITVDRVVGADLREERAVEAWVREHQDAVFGAALEVAP